MVEQHNLRGRLRTLGNDGEGLARRYLESKGYEFIAQHFHSRYGEIDLIMKDEDEMVFVEVKLRKNLAFGRAEESISNSKARKLIATANCFLNRYGNEAPIWRIDIVGIERQAKDWYVFHFIDAIRDLAMPDGFM